MLPVGDEPTQVAAADFNGDGRMDLAVASERDRNLWIILNVSPPSESFDVDLSRFVLAPANPLPLPSGRARQMFVQDLSGDGVPDVTLVIESDPVERRQDVVYFLSPGSLTGSSIRAVPGERTGTLVRRGNAWLNRQAAGHADGRRRVAEAAEVNLLGGDRAQHVAAAADLDVLDLDARHFLLDQAQGLGHQLGVD